MISIWSTLGQYLSTSFYVVVRLWWAVEQSSSRAVSSQQSSNRAVICVLVAKAGVRYVLRGTKADYNARAYGELVWLLNQVVD